MTTSKETKIYACEYIESMQIEERPGTEEYQVSIVLFEASNPEEAYRKAKYAIGTRHGYRFKNTFGEVVRDECKGIKDIEEVAGSWDEFIEWSKGIYGQDVGDIWIKDYRGLDDVIKSKDQLSIFNEGTNKPHFSNAKE